MADDFTAAARTIATECNCMSLRQASRLVSKLYDEALRPMGLQVSQLTVLVAAAMAGEKGASIGHIADALGLDRTTLTRNLRPLEKEGWLRVARDPTDARARIVLLTRAGERTIERAFPLWEQSQKRLRSLVGKGRVDELRKQLVTVSAKTVDGAATP
jgi:DNA-binding MarR family transcriptional regulator